MVLDLAEIDAIGTWIWAAIGRVLELAARNRLADDFRKVTDLIVHFGDADVKGLIVNGFQRGNECGEEGAADILDVDERPPGRSVRLNFDASGGNGPGDEIIEHHVEPHEG